MRLGLALSAAALALAAALPARAQLYITSVTASDPDPADAVPGFNKVPTSKIMTWSEGVPQAALNSGQSYNYCVTLASATANGRAEVQYRIAHGKTDILSGTIIKGFAIGSNGYWFFCSGYQVTPDSPGTATLSALVHYTPKGATKAEVSRLNVPVVIVSPPS